MASDGRWPRGRASVSERERLSCAGEGSPRAKRWRCEPHGLKPAALGRRLDRRRAVWLLARVLLEVALVARDPVGRQAVHATRAFPAISPRFWDEAWFRPDREGLVVVGAVPTLAQRLGARSLVLPRVGEMVHQGLPLAAMAVDEGAPRILPSPLSGAVVAVNGVLGDDVRRLLDDPCGAGWVAVLRPRRRDQEAGACRPRGVLLANSDTQSVDEQTRRLELLGCEVHRVSDWSELVPALRRRHSDVLMIDASSLGENGPEMVPKVHTQMPETRIVVIASPEATWEGAYRRQRVFYYAVKPFADDEIVDILDAAFRPVGQGALAAEPREPTSEPLSGICITNRDGEKVRLLAVGGLLYRGDPLGVWIRRKLRDRLVPVETTCTEASASPTAIPDAARTCDRVVALLAKDTGRLPGSLVRDTGGEFVPVPAGTTGRVTAMVVQPRGSGGTALGFDGRTTAALAEHIVDELTAPWGVPRSALRTEKPNGAASGART
jgi:glycine cleavage system H lipoate-binding protein